MNQYFSKEFFISPQNIIFEVTDKKVISDIDGFNTTLSYYKSDNFKGSDNADNEFSNLQAITDFNQNYIKFDMRLLRNNEEQSLQSAIVKGIVEFAKATNVSLIAEGVEKFPRARNNYKTWSGLCKRSIYPKPYPRHYPC